MGNGAAATPPVLSSPTLQQPPPLQSVRSWEKLRVVGGAATLDEKIGVFDNIESQPFEVKKALKKVLTSIVQSQRKSEYKSIPKKEDSAFANVITVDSSVLLGLGYVDKGDVFCFPDEVADSRARLALDWLTAEMHTMGNDDPSCVETTRTISIVGSRPSLDSGMDAMDMVESQSDYVKKTIVTILGEVLEDHINSDFQLLRKSDMANIDGTIVVDGSILLAIGYQDQGDTFKFPPTTDDAPRLIFEYLKAEYAPLEPEDFSGPAPEAKGDMVGIIPTTITPGDGRRLSQQSRQSHERQEADLDPRIKWSKADIQIERQLAAIGCEIVGCNPSLDADTDLNDMADLQSDEVKRALVTTIDSVVNHRSTSEFQTLRKSEKGLNEGAITINGSILLKLGFEEKEDSFEFPELDENDILDARLLLDYLQSTDHKPLDPPTAQPHRRIAKTKSKKNKTKKELVIRASPATLSSDTDAFDMVDLASDDAKRAIVTIVDSMIKDPSAPVFSSIIKTPDLLVPGAYLVNGSVLEAFGFEDAGDSYVFNPGNDDTTARLVYDMLVSEYPPITLVVEGATDDDAPPGHDFRGLSVHWLSEPDGIFRDLDIKQDEEVYKIEPRLRKKGEDKLCPRDNEKGAAYVDVAEDQYAGRSTHMLSYGWGYKVSLIGDALSAYCCNNDLDMTETCIWICFACVNQHRVVAAQAKGEAVPFEQFRSIFGTRVSGIGHILALMAPWKKPLYISRVWCVYEFFVAMTTKDVELDIIIPSQDQVDFCNHLAGEGVMNAVWGTIKALKVQDAEASVAEDKRRILQLVGNGPGCQGLNQSVMKRLQSWFADISAKQLQSQLDANLFTMEDQKLCIQVSQFLGDLAMKERYSQAVDLLEKALEYPGISKKPTSVIAAMHASRAQQFLGRMNVEDYSKVVDHLKKAYDIYDALDMKAEKGGVLTTVVDIYARMKDMKSARHAYNEAKAAYGSDCPEGLAKLQQKFASLYLAQAQSAQVDQNSTHDQIDQFIVTAIGALQTAMESHRASGIRDAIGFIACTTMLAKAHIARAELSSSREHVKEEVKQAKEVLKDAWSSLDTIGMSESFHAALVLFMEHKLELVEKFLDNIEEKVGFIGTWLKENANSVTHKSEFSKRAFKIARDCGLKVEIEDSRDLGEVFDRQVQAFSEGFQLLNAAGPQDAMQGATNVVLGGMTVFASAMVSYGKATAEIRNYERIPSWRAWTRPESRLPPELSRIAAVVLFYISFAPDEESIASKLSSETRDEMKSKGVTLAPIDGTSGWIGYLDAVRTHFEQLGTSETEVLLKTQKAECRSFLEKGQTGQNRENPLENLGNLLGGKGKGKGKAAPGDDADCPVQ